MATLVRRTPTSDTLLKPLADGDYAVAVLNRSSKSIKIDLPLDSLGFSTGSTCSLSVQNLWTEATVKHQVRLKAKIEPHDTTIWRLHPAPGCAAPTRTGAIVMTVPGSYRVPSSREIDNYGRCLTDTGVVHRCQGSMQERWTVAANGMLRAGKKCLAVVKGTPKMQPCSNERAQHWTYRPNGNLVNGADHLCLGVRGPDSQPMHWQMQPCEHNKATQIWALPN